MWRLLLAFVTAAVLGGALARPDTSDPELLHVLSAVRDRNGLPAMFSAVVMPDGAIRTAAVGVRRVNSPEVVTPADLVHLGSCTKAMTATLAARLVEQGKIRWTTTLGEVFTDLAPRMNPDWRGVTLREILAHRGGAPAEMDTENLWRTLWDFKGSPRDARRLIVATLTRYPPTVKPGREFLYSNAGYAMAGAMLETKAGVDWETLMRREVFGPLRMPSAGFGAPGSSTANNQPRGHTKTMNPVEPGPAADNPPAIGPAGTVHCSIADWARFVETHLQGRSAPAGYLRPSTFDLLHAPFDSAPEGYALGWGVARRSWAGDSQVALTHSGSNTMWYSVTWLSLEKKFAVLVVTNCGNDAAARACDEAAAALIATIDRPPAGH